MKRSPALFVLIICWLKAQAVLACACLLLVTPVHAQKLRQDAALAAALDDLNKGKVYEGIDRLKQIVRDDPAFGAAHFYLSTLYTEIRQYDMAQRHIELAIKSNPKQGPYHHQLGVVRRREGCRLQALTAFELALDTGMGKEEFTVWRNIGDVRRDLLEWEAAEQAYANALRIQPKDARTHLALGTLRLDRNLPDQAVSELRAALELDPTLAGGHATLGLAYRRMGDLSSAVTILQRGLELDPADQDSRYSLAQALLAQGRLDEGRQELDEYRRIDERISQTNNIFETAIQRLEAGQLDQAEKLLKQTLALAPKFAPALHTMGSVLLDRGNFRQSVDVLKEALESNPLNAETHFQLGTAFFRWAKLREALDATARAIVLYEDDARYHRQMGEIYLKLNRAADARAALNRAATLESQPQLRLADPYGSARRKSNSPEFIRQDCGETGVPR